MSESEEKQTKATRKQMRAEKKQQKAAKKAAKRTKVRSFPANKKGRHVSRVMNFWRVVGYPIHYLVYPFKLHGAKKVPDGACIFFGNHYCIFDIFYPAHTTWEVVHFVAKQSIIEAPVIGGIARSIGAIGAMRNGSDIRTVMEAMKLLRNGEKISLFPEGTRNKLSDEEFLPFHGGAALFAIKTHTPVVPFVICNRPKVFHKTHVMFGEPFELSEYYGRKLTQEDYEEAEEKLKKRLYELREEFRAERAKKKEKKA